MCFVKQVKRCATGDKMGKTLWSFTTIQKLKVKMWGVEFCYIMVFSSLYSLSHTIKWWQLHLLISDILNPFFISCTILTWCIVFVFFNCWYVHDNANYPRNIYCTFLLTFLTLNFPPPPKSGCTSYMRAHVTWIHTVCYAVYIKSEITD